MTAIKKRINSYLALFSIFALAFLSFLPMPPALAAEANLAQGKTAAASDKEADKFNAAKAFDGDTSGRDSRWASAADAAAGKDGGPHWIYVDLESVQNVKNVRIFWEQRKAKGYKIQVASGDTAPEAASDAWKTVKSFDSHPQALTDVITFGQAEQARFVRLYIDHNTFNDPDGGVAWGTVSVFEMEVYAGDIPESLDTVANKISVAAPEADTAKLAVTGLTNNDTYKTEFLGADYEQVVGADFTIFKPIVSTPVKLAFKVTKKSDNSYVFKEIPVTIPGKETVADGDNAAPQVLPELREWKGGTGEFTLRNSARVIYTDASFAAAANALAADYADIFGGKALSVMKGSADSAKAGDIVLVKTADKTLGLQDEGYRLEVSGKTVAAAETAAGAYWATRTILQAAKAAGGTIPQGTARDYPLYKVRGFMLDVGRKPFSLDYLKQMVKEMAWYKLNDFHIHLNDNYIWVEDYKGDSVNNAYSGFRLESAVKAGGNGGKNKADLTSKDMFYTKAEFAEFITDSAALGVNIIPEFDMPAHSLAFTKVRPDLRTPGIKRGADHLDLANQYDEAYSFITGVWDEYLKGDNPTFAGAKTVHVGADEYEASQQSYRKFVNNIFEHVENTGHKARIWGSLTQLHNGEAVSGAGREINIWNTGWANAKEMYNLGFELINTIDGSYYIVPNANYYYDYLNESTMYESAVNNMGGVVIPAGDPKMIGAAFAVWNDMIDQKDTGISEYDIFDRTAKALPLHGARMWGKPASALDLAGAKARAGKLGEAPNTNFHYTDGVPAGEQVANLPLQNDKDVTGNGFNLGVKKNAAIAEADFTKALRLNGGESYAEIGGEGVPETIGLGHSLRVKVKLTELVKNNDGTPADQILFESPYGTIKAVQGGTGKVGFSREGFDYSFDYALPLQEWAELEIRNAFTTAKLFVDGVEVGTLGSPERTKLKATMMIPFAAVGAKANAFNGFVKDVRIDAVPEQPFVSTMALERAVVTAKSILADAFADTAAADKKALQDAIAAAEKVAVKADGELTAAAVEDAIASLRAAAAKVKAPGADYRRVEALLAVVPADLSGYTAESAAAFETAKARVVRGLPKRMQAVVAGYEAGLAQAIAGLVLKKMTLPM
ncbi:family 20 glycosylhydrolase [Arcanobacterium hippocoleae]